MKLSELQEQQVLQIQKKKRKNRWIRLVVFNVGLLIFLLYWYLDSCRFEVTEYIVFSDKIKESVKIAVLSDLHSHEFGKDNERLIREIERQRPDLILACGDMVNDTDLNVDSVVSLCEKLTLIAPVYYIYGNHEGNIEYANDGPKIPLDQYLWEAGVTVCYYGEYQICLGSVQAVLFSVSETDVEFESSEVIQKDFETFENKAQFKIAVSHYPQIFYKSLYDGEFDLAIAGHFHGGQIIIPGVGGLYHKDTGFFPQYYGGCYSLNKGVLVVSRGLGNGTILPRINNTPELVMIKINEWGEATDESFGYSHNF